MMISPIEGPKNVCYWNPNAKHWTGGHIKTFWHCPKVVLWCVKCKPLSHHQILCLPFYLCFKWFSILNLSWNCNGIRFRLWMLLLSSPDTTHTQQVSKQLGFPIDLNASFVVFLFCTNVLRLICANLFGPKI